jgi:hypothetical protein
MVIDPIQPLRRSCIFREGQPTSSKHKKGKEKKSHLSGLEPMPDETNTAATTEGKVSDHSTPKGSRRKRISSDQSSGDQHPRKNAKGKGKAGIKLDG